ncbi:MAG TPA: rhodanese-related sulfurtransferase [Prochlorococcus sp.]|nr:rhodanese-related sulfurtransferase [Prochlorococcaceae cyanobacterium ETNP18_MAG_14]
MNSQDNQTSADLFQVAAFYCFTSWSESTVSSLLQNLSTIGAEHQLKGTVLLAKEGVNGTICGSVEGVSALLARLRRDLPNGLFEVKISWTPEQAFRRFKVRRKAEIVTMGIDGVDPCKTVGTYVDPAQWNALIDDPDTLLIDTRNDYEVAIGCFEGAINPQTKCFRDFPAWVEQQLLPMVKARNSTRVAMYCTGGIRCEKATSFLIEQGFRDVHHLRGGVLRYFEEVSQAESRWQGECFVFDQRVALNHQLLPGVHSLCYACGLPLTPEDQSMNSYLPGIQCRHCLDSFSDQDRIRFAERQRQMEYATRHQKSST